MWREGRIPLRRSQRDYNGLFLAWNRENGRAAPMYQIELPATCLLNRNSELAMSIAALDQDSPALQGREQIKPQQAPDFTIELETNRGEVRCRPLSLFGAIAPPLNVRFTKIAILDEWAYGRRTEPTLQTIAVPLSAFGFDAASVKKIRFRFDRVQQGAIVVSRISVGQLFQPEMR